MLLIGLTGGIGSGKSTVSEALARRGAVVIDADRITRELQEPGQPVLAAMVERFGPGIVQPDGTLDRQAVADIVFHDANALADLNAIVHPAVGTEIAQRLAAQVDTDPEVAVDRLVRFRGLGEADARARIARQASREERLARADLVIGNDGDRDALAAEVDRAWAWIEQRRAEG